MDEMFDIVVFLGDDVGLFEPFVEEEEEEPKTGYS